jgi:hypothetical protein
LSREARAANAADANASAHTATWSFQMFEDTAPDVIARFSIGLPACHDGGGSICVANRGNGFSVFINGGVLPDGAAERFFPDSNKRCLRDAFDFALSVAAIVFDKQVLDEYGPFDANARP